MIKVVSSEQNMVHNLKRDGLWRKHFSLGINILTLHWCGLILNRTRLIVQCLGRDKTQISDWKSQYVYRLYYTVLGVNSWYKDMFTQKPNANAISARNWWKVFLLVPFSSKLTNTKCYIMFLSLRYRHRCKKVMHVKYLIFLQLDAIV